MKYFYSVILIFIVITSFGQIDDDEISDRKTLTLDDNYEKYLDDGMKFNSNFAISTSISNIFRGLVGVNASFLIPQTKFYVGGGYSAQLFSGMYVYERWPNLSMDNKHTNISETFNFVSGSGYSISAGYVPKIFGFAKGFSIGFMYKNIDSKFDLRVEDEDGLLPVVTYNGTINRQFFNVGFDYRYILPNNLFISINQQLGAVRTTSTNNFDPVLWLQLNYGDYTPNKTMSFNVHYNVSIGYFLN